ncbi:hypothetical protein BC827DRAFT_1376608 [Russula dissimulans]|nr:hypothetical protein BC827DRAFT_1376608 [Russula dissimulans]
MLSLVLRRAILRTGPAAQKFPTRAVLFSACPSRTAQRKFATVTKDGKSGSTTSSESELEAKSKPKSTGRKKTSSTEAAGKGKAIKPKAVTIRPEDKPPKSPGSPYTLWMSEWFLSQPKIDGLPAAQNLVKQGAEVWRTVSEHEKQRYREKWNDLRVEYLRRVEEWREQVDPAVLRELNRRREARGLSRIRGDSRPLSGYFRYVQDVRQEYPRTEEDNKTYFKALIQRASSQWKTMNDVEKAKYLEPARADLAAWREKREVERQSK